MPSTTPATPTADRIPGVVVRNNARTGRVRYEAQIARPRVSGRRPAPITRTFDTADEAGPGGTRSWPGARATRKPC